MIKKKNLFLSSDVLENSHNILSTFKSVDNLEGLQQNVWQLLAGLGCCQSQVHKPNCALPVSGFRVNFCSSFSHYFEHFHLPVFFLIIYYAFDSAPHSIQLFYRIQLQQHASRRQKKNNAFLGRIVLFHTLMFFTSNMFYSLIFRKYTYLVFIPLVDLFVNNTGLVTSFAYLKHPFLIFKPFMLALAQYMSYLVPQQWYSW